jgi:hypothetical protein
MIRLIDVRLLSLVFLIGCDRPDDPTAAAAPMAPTSVGGALDPTLPDGNELSISSQAGVREPLRRAVETALVKAMAKARPCMDGIYGSVFAEVELGRTGTVTRAHIASPLLEDSPIAKCMEAELATMTVGKVEAPVSVRYPVRNMPSDEQLREAAGIVKQAL